MFSFLNYDNPIISGFFKLANLIILSLLWAIFCLPVFTSGASTTALYYTVQKTIKHERGDVWPCFWQSFKQNFKQATILTLILIAIAILFFLDITILGILSDAGLAVGYFNVIFIILIVLLCIYAFWCFSYIARFQNATKAVCKNAAAMAIMHLPTTVVVSVVGAAALFCLWILPPLLLIVPAVSVLIISLFMEKVFRRYMTEEDRKLEDERNMDWRDNKQKRIK